MIEVGAWVRVSSGGQDEENQVPDVERHCAAHGYRIAKRYELNDKSASKGEQQAKIDEFLADMRLGVIKVLVCWHSDRVERRGAEALLRLLRQTDEAGGIIESVKEPLLGADGMAGETTTAIGAIIAHQYSVHLAEQVGLAHARIRRNNGLIGSAPWGYEIRGDKYSKTLTPTDEGRLYIPQIFDRKIRGDSLRTIAEWLDSESVKPMRGPRWNAGSLYGIIRNMTYAGRRQDEGQKTASGKPSRKNKKTVMTCTPVVSMDIWRRANEALRDTPRRGPGVRVTRPDRPLLANLKCDRCADSPMYRISKRAVRQSGKVYIHEYYRCYGRAPQRQGCGNMIPIARLEEMVIARMLAWHDENYKIRMWVEGEDWEADIEDIVQSIRELNPRDPADRARRAELEAQLDDYESRTVIEGHWDEIDTGITKGQYFYDLPPDGRRDYLKSLEIRVGHAECCGGIHIIIEGREDTVHMRDCDTNTGSSL